MIYERAKLPRTQLVATDVIKIGRLPSCHVQLSDKRVAKVHAIIEVRSRAEFASSISGEEGTFLNGKRSRSSESAPDLTKMR